ncbi:MAG TPA: glucoamylase family protein [Gemmataceae bacterium]|nr:glucoamylase family protein [Gemmataceae bacterium]
MPRMAPASTAAVSDALGAADRLFLLRLQRQALAYFLDNLAANGLILDRQSNHGPARPHGLCSTAATGMGFIALALATAPAHSLVSVSSATTRIRRALETFLEKLPHAEGAVPHFVDSATQVIWGIDQFSTVETAWLVTGALWASAFLRDPLLESLAQRLYQRVNWHYWTAPDDVKFPGLLRHGKDRNGRFIPCAWDRANGETAFMYVLAAGADEGRRIGPKTWKALGSFHGSVAGQRFNNADLGLFVFQYGLDLLDLHVWRAPDEVDWMGEARLATVANRLACRTLADRYRTYQRYWGLSAGDGPGDSASSDVYRCYAPSGPIDGTAHVTATLASVGHEPELVLENIYQAHRDRQFAIRGRYGFSAINVDRAWVSRDLIGIDAGAAVLALDNFLFDNRVRAVFNSLPEIRRGLAHLGFKQVMDRTPTAIPPSSSEYRLAS